MRTTDYIDAAKEKLNISSDYAFSKWLGVTRNTISNYRQGIRVIDDMTATKLADIVGINPLIVIAQANLEREKSETGKKFWKEILGRVACVVVALPCLMPINSDGQQYIHSNDNESHSIYIMLNNI